MSISDKFRTWAEMDTEDDFIQYLERLVSGDPALSAASTASARSPGINRPLARLAHNTDALLDALIASETKVLVTDNELTGNIEFSSGVLTFTGIWKILEIAPIEDNVGLSIADGTTVTLGADNVVYAVLDRTGGTGTVAVTLQIAGGFMDLQNIMATATDKLDYIFIGYSTGGSGSKNVFRLFNGVSIQDGEQHSGIGVDTYYGTASIQRSNSGNSAAIQGGGSVSWSNAGNGELSWTAPLKFFIPGMPKHEISAGSHAFAAMSNFLYFVPNRDATSTETIDPTTSLVDDLAADIDIEGHDGVDLILVGRVNDDGESFVFANGRTLVDGSTIELENAPLETLSFTNGAGTTTDTRGHVTLSVSGTDGLELTTTAPEAGVGATAISMSPLWHDRFLTSLMSSPANTPAPTRVIFDALNPDGHVFLLTSAGNGELEFEVPGYDSTTFKLRLDGSSDYKGLELSDGEFAWILLPDRSYSGGTYTFYVSGSAGPTPGSSNDEIRTGAISAFPEANPNAFIIAYNYRSTGAPSTDIYHFLGIQGLRNKVQWPIFSGEAYRSILSNRNVTFSADRDFILEFGYDGPGTYAGPGYHYVRTLGVDRALRVQRPGWDYNTIIDSGFDTTPIFSTNQNDAVHVFLTWDDITLVSGHKTLTSLESDHDQEFSLDDNQIYFGTFVHNGGTTESIFVLWDGTCLHLDGENSRRYYGSSSRLEPAVQDGLEAAMDGVDDPSTSNKFLTENRLSTIADDHGTGSTDGGSKVLTGPFNLLMGQYVPFLNFDKVEQSGSFDPQPIYQVISGFDHIFTDSIGPGSAAGADRLFVSSGMAIFGDTFICDARGQSILSTNTNYWLGSTNNSSLTNNTHRANHCLELRESIWYGYQGGYFNSTYSWGDLTPRVPTYAHGHQWRVRSGNGTSPYNVWWGRNYIYICPDPDYTVDTGNGKLCSRVKVKFSKWPPSFSTSSVKNYAQGTRDFSTTLHSDGYGDDEGTWLCIGSVYMYARKTPADWLAASSFIAVGGDDDGTGGIPQAGGFSVSTNDLYTSEVRMIGFSKMGNQVTLESPLPIHYNGAPDGTNVWDDGVPSMHPSWDSTSSSTGSSTPTFGASGYNRDKGHFPNTGVSVGATSNPGARNDMSTNDGANLNLEPLLPELPIGKVDFKISMGVRDPASTGDDGSAPRLLSIKMGAESRVRESGSSSSYPTAFSDVATTFVKSWYIENLYHVHDLYVQRDGTTRVQTTGGQQFASGMETGPPENHDLAQHFQAEFSIPGLEGRRAILFRTEVGGGSVGQVFDPQTDSTVDNEPREGTGFYITGWTESFFTCGALDRTIFNVDIDEDHFEEDDGVADLQGKYGTWNDDT